MAYVPSFSHDIFISYAHLDNDYSTPEEEWVTCFRKHLEGDVNHYLGREVSVFFDCSHLRTGDPIEKVVEEAGKSAIFLAVLSRSWGGRDWTIKELDAFNKAGGASTQDIARVPRSFAVELLPVEDDQIPALLANAKRMPFYLTDSKTRIPHTLTCDRNKDDRYKTRIEELASDLSTRLQDLKKRLDSSPPPTPVPSTSRPLQRKTVFLAQATDDLYNLTRDVRAYLEDFGATVLPEGGRFYHQGGDDFAQEVRSDLERADLFVQLLSETPSRKPSDLRQGAGEPPQSYSSFQFEAAKRRRTRVLQWHLPGINCEKAEHDRQLLDGPDVRVMGLEEFKREIKATLERKKDPPPPIPIQGGFIIHAYRDDKDVADKLVEAFQARNRMALSTAAIYGNNKTSKEIDEGVDNLLVECDGLVLVCGGNTKPWVLGQLLHYAKIKYRREKEPRPMALLCAKGVRPRDLGSTTFQEFDFSGCAIEQLVDGWCGS
jgi:hypothetical protein